MPPDFHPVEQRPPVARPEEELQRSTERLRQGVRVAGLGLFEHDHLTDEIYYSPVLRQICGWSATEPVTLPKITASILPEDRPAFAVAVAHAHDPAGDGLFATEHRILRPDGKLRWVSARSQTTFAGEGGARHPLRTIGALVDITDRKQAEAALRESEAQFRALFESAPAGIAQGEVGTLKFISANQRYCDIIGYRREELDRLNFKQLTHPDDLPADLANLTRLLAGEIRQYTLEKRYLRKDGKVVWGSLTVAALWEPGAKPDSYMAVLADITERKQAEAALARLNATLEQQVAERTQALRQSEHRFRSIYEHAPTGIAIGDLTGRLVQCNAAFCEITGYTEAELRKMEFPALIYPADRAQNLELSRQLLRDEIPSFGIENRYLRKNGEPFWVHKFISLLRDEQGRGTHTIGLVTNINERKQLNDEILAAAERERERLGRNLHDGLCQLLTAARLKADSLVTRLAGQEPANVRTAKSIASLIVQAVDEAERMACGLEPVEPLPEGLMSALQQLAAAGRRLFSVACVCEFPRPVLVPDHKVATELFRIAQEAVNNAIKHGRAKTIRIRFAEESGAAVLTISSNGRPFPKLPRTTGMGLKSMRFRAGRLGATLQIRRGVRSGTLVRCVLPATLYSAAPVVPAPPAPKQKARSHARKK